MNHIEIHELNYFMEENTQPENRAKELIYV